MAFHPLEHNLLATASLDKHMKLIDMLSETVVSSTEGNIFIIITYGLLNIISMSIF